MPRRDPTLHLLCGKIAAGKSTLARRLASEADTLLISEDAWLSRLYPGEILSLDDYVRCSGRLQQVMGDHVVSLLGAGLSVVLDFQANTVARRTWMRGLFEAAGAANRLHYLDLPDSLCKARLQRRNAAGAHDFAPSAADYDLITGYFQPPTLDEGFELTVYREP
ncbi:MAG: ATP-binding protein [Kiloniellales bacterium]|nr:ATP-binding protein [Kiloniellales bacterium]